MKCVPLIVHRISLTHSVNGAMLCLSTPVDSCVPVYLSIQQTQSAILYFLEYVKCLLL